MSINNLIIKEYKNEKKKTQKLHKIDPITIQISLFQSFR